MASNVQIIAELLNVSENEAHDFCWAVQQIAGNSCDYRIIKEALLRHPDKRTSLTVFAEALKIEQVAQRAAAQQERKESEQRWLAQQIAAQREAQAKAQAEAQEETVTAKVFEFEGKKYLKTEEGILYDQATEECVGVWNEETKSIDEFADEED